MLYRWQTQVLTLVVFHSSRGSGGWWSRGGAHSHHRRYHGCLRIHQQVSGNSGRYMTQASALPQLSGISIAGITVHV